MADMDLISFAKRAIGVPFKEHGRDFDGWDCWGLIVCAYKHVYDIELPNGNDLYDKVMGKRAQEHLQKVIKSGLPHWKALPIDQARAGDVILMKLAGRPVHVGLLISRRDMIHVDRGCETGREPFREVAWSKRTEGFYRYKGM